MSDAAGIVAGHLVAGDTAGRWWLAGYEWGYRHGLDAGAELVRQALVPAAAALAEHRPSRWTPQDILAGRRREMMDAGPTRTGEQIRREALASWGLPVSRETETAA